MQTISKKTSLIFKITIFIVIIFFVFIIFCIKKSQKNNRLENNNIFPTPTIIFNKNSKDKKTMCPADVKQCSDGTYVGRIAPSCSFAPCP